MIKQKISPIGRRSSRRKQPQLIKSSKAEPVRLWVLLTKPTALPRVTRIGHMLCGGRRVYIMSSLQNLPQELYYAILSEIPTTFLQRTTLDLSRAIPHSPVPLQFLFESVTITRPEQVPQLYRRLKFYSKEPGLECLWIKSFTLLEWAVDADVLVNTLVLCTSLNHLSLRVGPVFAPEHLEDLFRRPFSSLISLNIRFRP